MNRGLIGALSLSVAFALLAGCGGSQPPIGAPGAIPQTRTIAQHAASGKSWMLPEASGEDLVYISGGCGTCGDVYVYSYPDDKLVGTLTGFELPYGECSDSSGNVFITTNPQHGEPTIYEYAHGGTTPIATLYEPGIAFGCAVDPKTGNLAVTSTWDPSNPYSLGEIEIYDGARGTPTAYWNRLFLGYWFCGYDNEGNLYASAFETLDEDKAELVRLGAGSGSIEQISVNRKLFWSGPLRPSVQWDGQHMTVTSGTKAGLVKGPAVLNVYQLNISGSSASVVGTTKLTSRKKSYHGGQTWIQGNDIVGLLYRAGEWYGSFWPYPQGGNGGFDLKKIQKHFIGLWGVTISLAQSRSRNRHQRPRR